MADVLGSLKEWSTTEGNNSPSGSTNISTNLDDNLRQIQSTVRDVWSRTTVASATTTDIGAVDHGSMNISGVTQIEALGTVSAGIRKWLTFEGALILKHNGTSLILPTGANITTAAGDTACFESLGSGNWRCLSYMRASGNNVLNASTFGDGTAGAPSIAFSSDLDTGIYRSTTNTLNFSAGGTSRMQISATTMTIDPAGALTIAPTGGSAVTVTPAAAATPGAVTVQGGTSSSATAGGTLYLKGGDNSSTGAGGSVQISSGAPSGGTNGNVEIQSTLRITGAGHLTTMNTGTQPVITSGGGTSPSIRGEDSFFQITLGTTPGTTPIVVTFGTVFTTGSGASYKVAIAQNASNHVLLRAECDNTTCTITPAASLTSGHIINVMVVGVNAST